MMKVLLGCNLIMLFIPSLVAQGQNPPEAPKPPAPAGRISAEQLSKVNNPLADMNALNFQNYYLPSLYGVPDAVTDGLFLRPVVVAGRQIVRATLPIDTAPTGPGQYRSGLGSFKVLTLATVIAPAMVFAPVAPAPVRSEPPKIGRASC